MTVVLATQALEENKKVLTVLFIVPEELTQSGTRDEPTQPTSRRIGDSYGLQFLFTL